MSDRLNTHYFIPDTQAVFCISGHVVSVRTACPPSFGGKISQNKNKPEQVKKKKKRNTNSPVKKLVVIAQLPIISRYRTQSTAVTIADRDFQKSKNTSRTTFRDIAEGVFCEEFVVLVLILLVITGVYEFRHCLFLDVVFVIVVVASSDLRRAVENKQCSCTDRTLIIQWY